MEPRYWIWTEDASDEQHATEVVIENVRQFTLAGVRTGRPLPATVPPFVVNLEKKLPPADFVKAGVFRFVSDKLKAVLDGESLPGVQYRPVTFKSAKVDLVTSSYFLLHVVRKVDCFDTRKSRYEMDTGPTGRYVRKIEELHLDEPRAVGERLFHLQTEGLESYLVVADSLAEVILRSGCTGCEFVAPNDVHRYFQSRHTKMLKD